MSQSLLFISITESIYLIYMFYFFHTTIDFNLIHHTYFDNIKILKHIQGNKKGLRICLFGRLILPLFICFLLIRNYYTSFHKYWISIIITSFILSLLNMNAMVYLLPIWCIELYIHIYFNL